MAENNPLWEQLNNLIGNKPNETIAFGELNYINRDGKIIVENTNEEVGQFMTEDEARQNAISSNRGDYLAQAMAVARNSGNSTTFEQAQGAYNTKFNAPGVAGQSSSSSFTPGQPPTTPANQSSWGTGTSQNPSQGQNSVQSRNASNPNDLGAVDEQGVAHDDPSKKYNTATGKPNARYNPAAKAPTTNEQQTSAPTAFFSGANLSMGSTNTQAVKQLQQALGNLKVDGIFGPKTLAAVKQFQLANNLKPDGIVGPQTMAALNRPPGSPTGGIEGGISSSQTKATEVVEEEESPVAQITRQIKQALGIKDTDSPQTSASKILKQAYKDLGYDTMKKEYENQVSGYTDLQDKKNDEIQKINNDPWYSEGVRVQKLQQLDKKYEGKELIFQNKIKLLETNISNAREDAQFLAGETINQMNLTASFNQDILLKAIDIAESQLSAGEDELTGPASVQEYKYAVQQGYSGSFSEYQNEDANRKISIAKAGMGGSGLTPSQINSTVNGIAGAFDNEPLVKEYNTINRAVQTFNSLGSSATDDIQRVYTFAKIADPTSAVKEGEYQSIEKYAQALIQRTGLRVSRVFSATGILTPEARTAMGKTVQTSLNAAKTAYNQVASEYQRQINDAYSGQPRQITDYSTTSNTSASKFDYLQKDIQISGNVAYLPRSVWDTVKGVDKDALLAEAEADGYKLLITN